MIVFNTIFLMLVKRYVEFIYMYIYTLETGIICNIHYYTPSLALRQYFTLQYSILDQLINKVLISLYHLLLYHIIYIIITYNLIIFIIRQTSL
jgi:hypothetical protein